MSPYIKTEDINAMFTESFKEVSEPTIHTYVGGEPDAPVVLRYTIKKNTPSHKVVNDSFYGGISFRRQVGLLIKFVDRLSLRDYDVVMKDYIINKELFPYMTPKEIVIDVVNSIIYELSYSPLGCDESDVFLRPCRESIEDEWTLRNTTNRFLFEGLGITKVDGNWCSVGTTRSWYAGIKELKEMDIKWIEVNESNEENLEQSDAFLEFFAPYYRM